MNANKYPAPVFVEINDGDEKVVMPFEEVVKNPALAHKLLQQSLAELQSWRQRYAAFFQRTESHAALEIVRQIEQLRAPDEPDEENGLQFDPDE